MIRVGRTVAAVVVAVVAAASAGAAFGAEHQESPVSLTVVRAGAEVPPPGSTVSHVMDVSNLGTQDVTGVEVRLALTAEPLGTSEDLAAFLADPGSADLMEVARREVGVAPPADGDEDEQPPRVLAGMETRQVTVSYQVTPELLGEDWGVYGVAYGVREGNRTAWVDAGAMTWIGEGMPTLPLSFVATVTDGPTRASSLLTAADHPRVALMLDVASFNEIPAPRPSLADREVYRLPWGHPDLSSLAHAEAQGLGLNLVTRSDALAPRSVRGAPWVAVPPVVDGMTVDYVTELGAVAIMAEARYGAHVPVTEGPGGAVVNVTDADGTSTWAPVIVPHPTLSQLVASYRPHHPTTPGRIVAEAALVAGERDGITPVVISPGPSWVVDGTVTSPVVTALFDAPFVTEQSLAATLSYPAREEVAVPSQTNESASIDPADLSLISRRMDRLTAIANATANPAVVLDPAYAELTPALSLWNRTDASARAVAIEGTVAALDERVAAVGLVTSSAVNLVSSSGNLPVTVRNDLDVPVTVHVHVTSRSPILVVEDTPTITVEPRSEAIAVVPVTAVSSGNVELSMVLRNTDGVTMSDYHNLSMRVRAEWGNTATAIGTAALVVLLIAGVVRTVRRGRAETRLGPKQAEPKGSEA